MDVGRTLRARSRGEWRRWLEKNHAKADEVWLVFHRKDSGRHYVPYADAVEEALCFGWIDSIVKPLGDGARAQRFTPRRPGSNLSELNRERMRSLIKRGLMTKAGLAAVSGLKDAKFKIAPDILRALKQDPEVWANFRAFPESYRRVRIGWIQNTTGNAEIRAQRLRYLIKMTKAGKKFGSHQ
jgi:uncharacterized protein YdeI (YjbR/CyaY-like superfamily)